MSDFDERSGVVACDTEWGRWWQTIDDVTVEVQVVLGTKAKDIKCIIKPNWISVTVNGSLVFEGEFAKTVQADDSFWTLEDKKLLRIFLVKADKTASNCWSSLLTNHRFEANLYVKDQMEKKLTLQGLQFAHPGMDFSGADITGNYQGGGPVLP